MLLNAPFGLALLIFLWPLALILIPVQIISLIVLLPILIFVELPLSVYLYKKRNDNVYLWTGAFFCIAFVYVIILAYLNGENPNNAGFAFLVIQNALTGFFMWLKFYTTYLQPKIK